MSTGLQNAGLVTARPDELSPGDFLPERPTEPSAPGRDALQALLAFSALHEQIRRRRARQGTEDGQSAWQLEEFVLDEVLQLVAERARSMTGADGVAIALADKDAIVCRVVAGSTTPDPGMRLQPNSGFSGACLASGTIVRCDDSESDRRVNPITCRQLGARSMVAVPLAAKEHVIGLLEAFSSEAYGFNDADVRNLALLAELILAALKPEEEDRLAEISKRVVPPEPVVEAAPEATQVPAPAVLEEPGIAASTITESDRLEAFLTEPTRTGPHPGLAVVFALIALACVLGAGLWWSIRRHTSAQAARPSAVAQAQPPASMPAAAPAAIPQDQVASQTEDGGDSSQTTPSVSGTLADVTGLRHWSTPDSSVVAIDLQDQVQYEAHRLTNPDRIYFDLHDTRLSPSILRNLEVGDELLQRVRAAQLTPNVTRVVLETKGSSNFSVSLEPNPYRLLVELRKIGAKPQARNRIDLFGPMNSPEAAALSPNQETILKAAAAAGNLRIVLDAGHGGWDLGTVGRKGLLEKDLVLDIVGRLGKLVQNGLHAGVIYTRTDDSYITLEKRAEMANLANANLFLSIHANYSDYPSARGVETYFTNTYSSEKARPANESGSPTLQGVNWTSVDIRHKVLESRRLASSIQHALYGTLAAKNPGLRNRGVKEAQYVVLTGTSMPSVLAEISFVSSPTDENNLQSSSYRQRIAEALYQGLAHYSAESGLTLASVPRKTAAR